MRACSECLARGLLLRSLAGHIDRAVSRRAGERARELLALDDLELIEAVSARSAAAKLRRSRAPASVRELEEEIATAGCWSVCKHDELWPAALHSLGPAMPRALFATGDLKLLERLEPEGTATIVGARRAGSYGLGVAEELSRSLSAAGVDVVSGLALGIDSAAHEGALAGGGGTVAVLGTGPERAYPRSRRRLYERIRERGLVLSELPCGSPTFRWMFPARNRVMAALAGITVVIEAAERSGSLITAEMAADGGRQVGAVPGPVTSWRSQGTNKLIAEGAALIRDAQDVLDALLGPGVASAARVGPPVTRGGRIVLGAVADGAATVDRVAGATGEPFGPTLAALGRLERDGYLRSDGTGRYVRTALRTPPPGGAGEQATIGE